MSQVEAHGTCLAVFSIGTSVGTPAWTLAGQERNLPMTQELVLGVLLAGFVGLVWAMTVSVLLTDHDHSVHKEPGLEVSTDRQGGMDVDKDTSKRRTVAA